MTSEAYIQLSYFQVGAAAALILVVGAISLGLQLGLEKSLFVAGTRTVLQLCLVGALLEWVFRVERWYVIVSLAAVMTLIAGATAARRGDRQFPGMMLSAIVSVWAASWIITAYGLALVLQGSSPWQQPQYVIPLLGMVLGNALNGISLGLNSFTEALVSRRAEIEAMLALGATRWEAARPVVQLAVRNGLTPVINSMLVVGIVSLPGMMTGQLMAGAPPIEAVKYQVVIMFLIAAATALGTVGVVALSFIRLFNHRHQFLYTLIRRRGG